MQLTIYDATGQHFTEEGRIVAKKMFVETYREFGNVRAGCAAAGISRKTFYYWMERDDEFVEMFQHAKEDYNDRVRGEIHRRAVRGVKKEHREYFKGELIDTWFEEQYSDSLLKMLAAARMPEFRTGSRGGLDEAEDAKIPLSLVQELLRNVDPAHYMGTQTPSRTDTIEGEFSVINSESADDE